MKFTPKAGRIDIDCHGDSNSVCISVTDTGVGVRAEDQAVIFEEAGYSILGPQALNCAAPDEGNMHILSVIATPEQRERYLAPLAAGHSLRIR